MSSLFLLTGLLGCLVAVAGVVAAARGAAIPASAGWIVLTAAAAFATVASVSEISAVAQLDGSGNTRALAGAIQGAATARSTAKVALAAGFCLVSLGGTIAALLTPGPDSTPGLPVTGLLGGVVGTVASAVVISLTLGFDAAGDIGPAFMLLPPVAAALALFSMVGAIRTSDHGEHRGRAAAWRGLVGLASLLMLGMLGEVFVELGIGLAFSAVANAPADRKVEYLTNGLAVAASARPFAWALGLIPALTAWGTVIPVAKDIGPPQRLGIALASVQALVIVAGLTWSTVAYTLP